MKQYDQLMMTQLLLAVNHSVTAVSAEAELPSLGCSVSG